MKNNSHSSLKLLCFVFCMLLAQLLSAQNMIVNAPNNTYDGTYIEQSGVHNSCRAIEKPYYRLESTNYYLYADYLGYDCASPSNFVWFISDGIKTQPIYSGDVIYFGQNDSNYYVGGPESCNFWRDASTSGNVTSSMSITEEVLGTAPVMSALEASLITTTAGIIGGNVVANGGATVSARGLVYSSSDNKPTLAEVNGTTVIQIPKDLGLGSYYETLTTLSPGVTYYRAYLTNSVGTVYGNDVTLKTADVTPPALVSSLPTDNATNMTLGKNIVLNFNDKIVADSGNITIRIVSDNSIFEQIPISDARINISDSMVIIDPSANLLKATEYYIEIDASALNDDDGNSFVGISGNSILNFTTIDVVINEVVTDPEQDWSSSSYSGNPGGTAGSTDEWIEILIKSDSIDLTGWTIDLTDSSPVSGDLTDSPNGAFRFSGYISAGIGTFNKTLAGDYLVLGNVRNASINNSITLTLKDSDGVIVDEISFTNGAAADIYNETIQRYVDGLDTGNNTNDLTKGMATPGASNTGPSVVLSVSNTTIAEAAGTSIITATLSASCSEDVTVNIGANATGSTVAGDYTFSTTSILISSGDTEGAATLTAVQDLNDEINETVLVDIVSVTNGLEAGTQQQTVTITDDDDPPIVTLSQSTTDFDEDAGVNTITATLSEVSGKDVTVSITETGDATSGGIDYTLSSTSILIPAGSLFGTVTITAEQDLINENSETITIDITNIVNGIEAVSQQISSSIIDDDFSVISIEATLQAEENATDGLFTISTDKQFSSAVTVNFDVNGTATESVDYLAIGTSVTFPALTSSITMLVDVIDDALFEGNETVIVGLTGTNNVDVNIAVSPDSVATVTINDNEVPPTVNFTLATQSSSDESGVLNIIAELSEVCGLDVTIPFTIDGSSTATGGGSDYSITGSPVTISAGSTTATITITVANDVLDEYNETVIVNMGTPLNATQGVITTHVATISDDDVIPDVTTLSVLNLLPESVLGRGFVNSLGSLNPTAHGVCWSQSTQPTVANNHTDEGVISKTGNFTSEITSLAPGTLYYLRAYITNAVGTSYGDEESFTTLTLPIAECQDTTVFLNSEGIVTIDSSYINDGSSASEGIQSISLDLYDFSCMNIGDNTVELTVTDVFGYTSSCTANILVKDTVFPVVFCNSITVTLYNNGEYVLNENDLKDIAEGTIDNCTSFEDLEIEVFPRSFECVHVGELIDVKVTVYDESGNNANCWTTVSVLDETLPVALCKDLNLMLDENGEARIYPAMVNGGDETILLSDWEINNDLISSSYDACGISELSLNKYNFDCSNIGENTVTLTVFDAHGNSASCESTVMVSDNIIPTIEPVNDVELVVELGSCESVIDYPEIVVNDNCETVLELIDGIGTDGLFPVGITTETWKSTDDAGNTATVSFNVIVTSGNNLPTIDAVNDFSVNEDTYSVIVNLNGISYGNDCEEQEFTVLATRTNQELVTSVDLIYKAGSATGTLEIIINPEMSGSSDITVTVEDSEGGIVVEEFMIMVTSVNDAPFIVNPIADQTVNADHVLKVPISSVLGEMFDDIDNDMLTIDLVVEGTDSLPGWAICSGDTIVCTPTISDTSCVNIVVTATDAEGLSVSDTFEICVEGFAVCIGDLGANQFTVQMYPNPTRGAVNLDISSGIYDVELSVHDITGKTVLRKLYTAAEKITFDMSGKVSGMYFVHINTSEKQIMKKLVVDRNKL